MSDETILVPIADGSGNLFNDLAAVKSRFSADMNAGKQNVRHYSDSAISDGSTDARAAILAADAVGPVLLPPGTYAVASNMTLSNKITFDPGAKLKPASGITITLNGGYIAEDTQHVFDVSAGGSVVVAERSYITPEHFGAIGDGVTNDFAALKASKIAANSSGAVWKSIGDGRTYLTGTRLELDDSYDGFVMDFSNDWIEAINLGWSSNDVLVMKNGEAAYSTSARDYAHYRVDIKEVNIDGGYDFAGFLTDLETAYDADPGMSDGDVLTELSTAQSANGTLYNGLSQYVSPSGTGSANPTFEFHADRIKVRNCGKGGVNVSNPKSTYINSIHASNCVVHAFLADLTIAAADLDSGEISLFVNKVEVDTCSTAFDLSTSESAYASTYDTTKFGNATVDVIDATNILNRTKIHGPWNLDCNIFASGPQHRVCRYPVFTVVDGLPERKVTFSTFACDTANGGIQGTARWDLGTVRLRKIKRYAVSIYGNAAKIKNLFVDTCPFPYRGSCEIGYFKYENTVPTDATYQCAASTDYPFYSEGVTKVGLMEAEDPSIGVVSASQTYATYAWYFNTNANGSVIDDLRITTSILEWEASTAVTSGELRSSGDKIWSSNSSRTTGVGTFDVTEQANWTEVGRGTGKVKRAIYVDDNSASDYLIRIGSLTGRGHTEHHVQQYSGGVPPLKPSIEMITTDAGALQWTDVFCLRNRPLVVNTAAQLKALTYIPAGMPAITLGYTSVADGHKNEYVYRISSRPGTESVLALYGSGSTDWWESTNGSSTATTAQLDSLAATVNTTGKYKGKQVFNSDTNKPVYALGSASNAQWVDATGATAHTPV